MLMFCQYDPPSYTNFGKPYMILGISGVMVVVNMDDEACLRAVAIRFFPRERSRKKTGELGCFECELAPDGFFDLEVLESIILR